MVAPTYREYVELLTHRNALKGEYLAQGQIIETAWAMSSETYQETVVAILQGQIDELKANLGLMSALKSDVPVSTIDAW